MNTALVILGLCPLGVPGDVELSIELCRMQWEAQQRTFAVKDDWTDERRAELYRRVCEFDRKRKC